MNASGVQTRAFGVCLTPLVCLHWVCHMLFASFFISSETAVGKSSLVLRFVREEFYDYQEVCGWFALKSLETEVLRKEFSPPLFQSTIGAAFLTHTINVPPSDEQVKFEIWYTAGQERYRSLAPMYYRSAC